MCEPLVHVTQCKLRCFAGPDNADKIFGTGALVMFLNAPLQQWKNPGSGSSNFGLGIEKSTEAMDYA
jgi:hypothetical protein